MRSGRVGTVIHGALGDCYEQLCCLHLLKRKYPEVYFIGFFVVRDRMEAMLHFDLCMLDEVHLASDIENIDVDYFFQYQVNDVELMTLVLNRLTEKTKAKFDFSKNIKPWSMLKKYNFKKSGLRLELSDKGRAYLPECLESNGIDKDIFKKKFTIGYLWRYRSGGAIKPYFQRSREWILKTKSALFKSLIDNHNAYIMICGMGKNTRISKDSVNRNGVVAGEYLSKFTEDRLNIPDESCTYLKGLGYAAEMEIMSRCDLLLMMPSGFSEPLWMMRKMPVVLIDPPPFYMAKLWWNQMPFFDNQTVFGSVFNTFIPHTPFNVLKYLHAMKYIPTLHKKYGEIKQCPLESSG